MDVLGSRLLIRPTDLARSQHFYGQVLGLAIAREFGPPDSPGLVFYAGNGLLEVSGQGSAVDRSGAAIWLQVRDITAEHERLRALGAPIDRSPRREPWGLLEMWLHDPDGVPIVIVEVPHDHPLRKDVRQ